ncbi:DNA translocase FTSK [Nostoc phage YongM]|nr:DNA translocase FTSK [Nostoc phage YongM]
MKKPLGNFLKSEIDSKYLEAKKKLLLIKTLGFVSVALFGTAIANPKQPKTDLVGQLGISSIFSLLAAYISNENSDLFAQYDTFVKMNREHKKNELSLNFGKAMIVNEVANEIDLASRLENLPSPAQLRYIEKYQLQGLLNPVVELPPESYIISEKNDQYSLSLNNDLHDLERETQIDLSWIDSQFVNSSKIVVGAKGSGKSVYLRYEAARWLIENPTGYLLIIDPHYDRRLEAKHWLSNLDQRIVMKMFLSKFKDTRNHGEANEWKGYLYHLRNCWVELQSRINDSGGDFDDDTETPVYTKVKVVIDELENIKNTCNESEFKEILKFIDCVQNEGRKYNFEVTVGMHGLKKETTGLDSTTVSQMNWFLFEKACYDPTTKYPSDFDSREIKETAKVLSSNLDPRVGRTVVIIKQELTSPIITVLPLLKAPVIGQNVSGGVETQTVEQSPVETYKTVETETPPESQTNFQKCYLALLKWCKDCQTQLNQLPDRATIAQAWQQLTGDELSDKALDYLIEKLFSNLE